jgi:methylated-DNA-[protein]-cysteine S-methyltransferase
LLSSTSFLSHPEKAFEFKMGTTKPKGSSNTKTIIAVSARHTSTGTTSITSTHAKRILAAAAEKYSNDATRILKKGGLTSFQSQVYLALCQVPQGSVTTYKHIATHINCKSSQAVGQALKRNPWAPAVPCHRVVSSDLTLGGFFGVTKPGAKMDQKITLLRQEGVRFQDNGRIDPDCVYRFDD